MWMRAVWVSVLLSMAVSVSAQDVVDRLKVPGPIGFSGETFRLAWTSNPSDRLYKQEYLPAGQTLERYESMLMLDLTFDGATPRQKACISGVGRACTSRVSIRARSQAVRVVQSSAPRAWNQPARPM